MTFGSVGNFIMLLVLGVGGVFCILYMAVEGLKEFRRWCGRRRIARSRAEWLKEREHWMEGEGKDE